MRKVIGWFTLILGIASIIISNIWKGPIVAKTATLQLEDSAVTYGIAKYIVTPHVLIDALVYMGVFLFILGIYLVSTKGNKN